MGTLNDYNHGFLFRLQQTLVDKVSRRQRVDMSLLFLNIKVRRLQLVSDSLDEVIALCSQNMDSACLFLQFSPLTRNRQEIFTEL